MRRANRLLLQGLGAALVIAGQARAQDVEQVVGRHRIINGKPCVDCPPATTTIPWIIPPTEAPKVDPKDPNAKQPDPKQPDPVVPPTDTPTPGGETSSLARGGSSVAISMFGNQFGRSTAIIFPNGAVPASRQNVTTARSFQIRDGANPGQPAILTAFPPNQLRIGSLTVLGSNLGPQSFQTATDLTSLPSTVQLLENAAVSNALRTANPGQTVVFTSGNATLVSSGLPNALYQTGPLNYNFTGPAAGQPGRGAPVVVLIPGTGSGGSVGRTPVYEGNSPLPRDRVIFDSDYFDGVPIGNGADVRRFSPGFEKMFLDGRASIEVRMPFASTLDSNVTAGGFSNTNTEFGNVNLTFKALVLSGDTLNVALGAGVSLPTADDTSIRLADGTGVLRIQNEAVVVTPYVAALFTPNDRFFAQAWAQASFDPNGNGVTSDAAFFGTGGNLGNLRDSTILALDAQLGYWIYRSEEGRLRGLAPFAELHYNGSISNGSLLTAAPGFFIGDQGSNYDALDMTVGLIAQFGNRMSLTTGLVLPLRTGNDRTFDYQLGMRFNWFFGQTASGGNSIAQTSGF